MHPNILITGLAKTGTTILFSRIRETLGDPLKTFFEPSSPDQLAAILEEGLHTPTLTKCLIGHVSEHTGIISRFSHHLLIVRDPRDQFVSEMLYDFYKFQEQNDPNGFAAAYRRVKSKCRHPQSRSCSSLFSEVRSLAIQKPLAVSPVRLLKKQYQLLEACQKQFNPFTVRYEDIVDNRLDGLAAYLGVSSIKPAEVDASVQRVRRTKSYGDWKHWFTREDLEEFHRELGDLMRQFGYTDHQLPAHPRIPAATSLAYIRQFAPPAAKRRRLRLGLCKSL